MTTLDRALERVYREEVARFEQLFGADVAAGKFQGIVNGNNGVMRLALALERCPAFTRLSYRRRLLILTGAPRLVAARRSGTTAGAEDEVLVLAAWCLADGVLTAARRTA